MIQLISPLQLQDKINARQEILILDVREPWEFEIVSLANSLNVPLRELSRYCEENDLPKCVVAVCHHGVRSIQACAVLESFGITEAYSLAGGIDAYARTIDTSLKLY